MPGKYIILHHPAVRSLHKTAVKVSRFPKSYREDTYFCNYFEKVFVKTDRTKTVKTSVRMTPTEYKIKKVTGPVYEFSHIEQKSSGRNDSNYIIRTNHK